MFLLEKNSARSRSSSSISHENSSLKFLQRGEEHLLNAEHSITSWLQSRKLITFANHPTWSDRSILLFLVKFSYQIRWENESFARLTSWVIWIVSNPLHLSCPIIICDFFFYLECLQTKIRPPGAQKKNYKSLHKFLLPFQLVSAAMCWECMKSWVCVTECCAVIAAMQNANPFLRTINNWGAATTSFPFHWCLLNNGFERHNWKPQLSMLWLDTDAQVVWSIYNCSVHCSEAKPAVCNKSWEAFWKVSSSGLKISRKQQPVIIFNRHYLYIIIT